VTVAARCLTVATDMGIAKAVLSCLEELSKLNTKSDALFTFHARGGIFILQIMHYPEYIEFLIIQPDDFAAPGLTPTKGLILNAGMPRWIGFTAY
jgi:hypothetical protein